MTSPELSSATSVSAKPGVRFSDLHLLLCGMFLVLFGTKAALIGGYGSSMPFWDQWDGEAAFLYLPYLKGELSLSMLLDSHNEHRILVGRLLALGLFELAGGWDPLLQMLVNAVLHATFLVLLVRVLAKLLPENEQAGLVFATMLLFILPIGWENIIAGFQSQFYLLLIFSLLSIMAFARAPAFSPIWFLGIAAAVAGYFSMASGALTLFAVAGVIISQMITRRRSGWKEWLALALLIALGLVMLKYVDHVEGHDGLKAESLQEFLSAFILLAGLPLVTILGAAIVHAPIIGIAVQIFTHPEECKSVHWIVLGMSGWVALQILSLAYGRAEVVASSRYLDLVIIALPVNYAALRYFARRFDATLTKAKWGAIISSVWLWLMVVGLAIGISLNPFPGMFDRAALRPMQMQNVRNYLASGNLEDLDNKPFQHIPYPSAQRLASLLSDPIIRSFLPIPVRPDDADVDKLNATLMLGGKTGRIVTLLRAGVLRFNGIFIAFGVAALFLVFFRRRRDTSPNGRAID